jgi:hypothetical protein
MEEQMIERNMNILGYQFEDTWNTTINLIEALGFVKAQAQASEYYDANYRD